MLTIHYRAISVSSLEGEVLVFRLFTFLFSFLIYVFNVYKVTIISSVQVILKRKLTFA